MNPIEYLRAQQAVRMALAMLMQVDLDAAIDAGELAESVGPMLDPTLYREKGRALHQDVELFRAAAAFKRAAERISEQKQ